MGRGDRRAAYPIQVKRDQRSRTAEGTAALRAAHQLLDDDPPVLADPFAERLLGADLAPALRPWAQLRRRVAGQLLGSLPGRAGRLPIGTRRLRAQVVVRSRYAEDRLESAVARGVDQYLVLAAGLDSFSLRRADLADRLRVFEIDHPASQADKARRLESLGSGRPRHLELVPIDFESETLAEALERSSFDSDRPAFVSWLGVTYYLSRDAILATLRFVAGLAPGSEMALDFWSAEERSAADRALLLALRFSVAGVGEQMVSFFDPESLRALAEEAGLEVVDLVDRNEADRRYLVGRRDGLAMPEFAYLATLAV